MLAVIVPTLYPYLRLGPRMHLLLLCHGRCLSSGCYNRAPQTRWLQQQKFIFTVLEAEAQDQGTSMVGDWWGFSSWFVAFLLYLYMVKRKTALGSSSSYKETNPIMSCTLVTLSKPYYLPKVPLPNTITCGGRVLAYEFWVHTIAREDGDFPWRA